MHTAIPALCALLFAAVDQGIKALVRRMPVGQPFFRCPPVFELTHCQNTGAAFSLLGGQPALLAAVTVLLVAALWWMLRSMRLTPAAKAALVPLLGGGLGNWIDRVCFGAVTDYIRLLCVRFPVFNLADIGITLSVGAMLILLATGRFEARTEDTHAGHL